MNSSQHPGIGTGSNGTSRAAVGRRISYGAAVLGGASLVAASMTSGDFLVGVLVAAALIATATAVALFGLTVGSPRAAVRLLLILHLICVAGIVAIAFGLVSSIIGLFYGSLVMSTVSLSDWWPGAALDTTAATAKLRPEQSFVRMFSAGTAGAYLLAGAVAVVFVLRPPTFVFFLVLGVGGALLLLYVRRLGSLMVASHEAS